MKYKVGEKIEAVGGPCIGMHGVITGIDSGRNTPYSVKYDDGTVWQNRECNIKLLGNYAIINGERIELPSELTAEQRRALGIKPKFDIELHLELSRLLWQFAIDNGGVPEFQNYKDNWTITIYTPDKPYVTTWNHSTAGSVRFASESAAQRALDEIAAPFLAAHDFGW